ncbi:MAG: winged helix-turn-helix transcriptional regulator [Planctomycetes bacterium]|nr:winged helix-turn-helix transcriptional regulator [Planctomycetota bacterium]
MLLEYLVPSRARREVLKSLRSTAAGLSVRGLSRAAGVPYSGAYREVARLKRMGVVRTRRSGRALHCSWNGRNPAAKALAEFLAKATAPGLGNPDEEDVFWNLRRWGAPLVRTGAPSRTLSIEETLAHGLVLARRYPDVARVWPLVLARNRSKVDFGELEVLARRLGQRRTLGFLLSVTGTILRDRLLLRRAAALRDSRARRTVDFFLQRRGKRAQALADRNTPAEARRWRFRMNMPLESFRTHLRRFRESS